MGIDKALVEFRGQPLIAHMINILREAGLSASIAGQRSNLSGFAPVTDDLGSEQGPLAGICSSFAVTSVTWLVFVPVDLPLLPSDLIKALLHHARATGCAATLPALNGFTQTFPCVLHRDCAPILGREFAAGRGGCFSAFQRAAQDLGQPLRVIPVELLAQAGQISHPDGHPAFRWFFNLNARADFEHARAFRTGLVA